MTWTIRRYSKSKINAAGRYFLGQSYVLSEDPFEIVNNWRSCHAYPLHVVAMTLRGRARKVDPSALVAQRTKRLVSIILKLGQNPNMQLARMQDVGGCRAVVRRASEVDRLTRLYESAHAKAPRTKNRPVLIRKTDYIKNPKVDGYRGVHLIMRYQTNSRDKMPFQGQNIEIQLRSKQQHAWATAVETAQTFTGQALKSKIKNANENWLRFFALMGSEIAHLERRPLVPDTPSNPLVRVKELLKIQQRERIIECLEAWDRAVHIPESRADDGADLYLLLLDTTERMLHIRSFSMEHVERAEREYMRIERATQNDPEKNVVLVSVDSVRALPKAYPNYFVDSSNFIKLAKSVLRMD